MADTEDKVNKAKQLINNVIETAASIPEGQNELKRNQLRELATLNGTLRDDENQACQNCGQIGHRKYDCPERENFTANVICRVCGNAGHMARDCPDRQRGTNWRNDGPPTRPPPRVGGAEQDYAALMNGFAGADGAPPQRIEAGPGGYDNAAPPYGQDDGAKPWERGPASAPGGPAPWGARPREDSNPSGAAPWASGGHRGGESYGYGNQQQAGYGMPPAPGMPGAAAPWAQGQPPAPPAQGYGGYPAYGGYNPTQAPQPWLQGGYPSHGAVPPPPPGEAPPPPPSDQPPPPPPPM